MVILELVSNTIAAVSLVTILSEIPAVVTAFPSNEADPEFKATENGSLASGVWNTQDNVY
jgi:hypothetical protein